MCGQKTSNPRGRTGPAFEVVVGSCRERAVLHLVGVHNIYNALAAIAVGLERGLSPSEAVAALASLVPADKRGQVVKLGNITVINDCYNCNPKALDSYGRCVGGDAGEAQDCCGR